MLTINGKKFARNDSEFTETLFERNGTATGFYKKHKGGLLLLDMNKKPFAAVINNRHGETFFVSVSVQPNGQMFYMYGTSTETDKVLGIDMLSYSEGIQAAKNAINYVYK